MPSTDVKNAMRNLIKARREEAVAAEKEKKAKKKARDAENLLLELLEESGETSTTVELGEGYGKVQFVPNKTVFSKVFNEQDFIDWAKAEGRYEEFFKDGVRKASLNQVIREALSDEDGGTEFPPGVDFSEKRYVTVTQR